MQLLRKSLLTSSRPSNKNTAFSEVIQVSLIDLGKSYLRLNSSDSHCSKGSGLCAQLDQLNTRATEDTSQATNIIVVNRLEAMSSQLKTRDQRVFAAVIEALAQGVLDTTNAKSCAALRRVAAEAPGSKHASDHATMLSSCKELE